MVVAKKVAGNSYTIVDIALRKSWIYCMDYDPTSGREVEKQGALYLKQGFIDGFLAGVAHKFNPEDDN